MSIPTPVASGTLSAMTDADISFLKELGSREEIPQAGEVHEQQAEETFHSRHRDALRIAAFLGEFDPLALFPDITEEGLKVLLTDCTVSSNGVASRWRLTAAARSRLLSELAATPEEMKRSGDAALIYLESIGEPPDAITIVLVELSSGVRRDRRQVAASGNDIWAAYQTVLADTKDTPFLTSEDADRLLADVRHAEMLDPFRFLTGWDAVTGSDTFVGRTDELERLRSFVDVLRSQGLVELTARAYARITDYEGRALLLSGVGGVGKSTLAAKFMLQHAEFEDRSDSFRFANLDFDRSTVSAIQPATLLMEIARQLSWQVPQAREALDALRERVRGKINHARANADTPWWRWFWRGKRRPAASADTEEASEHPPELLGPLDLDWYVAELSKLIVGQRSRQSVMLLVLDTFEEVQALGDEAVRRVEALVESALSNGTTWRILVVGRDEAADFLPYAPRMVLSEFRDVPSRRAFLEARGVPRAVSARVAKEVGGRPLALVLAARLVKEQGVDAVRLSFWERFRGLFRDRLTEGMLYERILLHIGDEDVRRIAHPGLVLRRLDADVIASVIVPALKLEGFTAEKIRGAMDLLRRQKDLVRVESDGSVTHRPDVRAQMLLLMSAEKPEMVERLHRAAVDYYVGRQASLDAGGEVAQRYRIEELYHRLCLGTDLDAVVTRWIARARVELARALEEIVDDRGRGGLKIMLGRLPSPDEARDLPPLMSREFAVRAVRSSIALHAPEKALASLEEFSSSIPAGVADMLWPIALDRAGHWPNARPAYSRLLEAATQRPGYEATERVLAAADFFERVALEEQERRGMTSALLEALTSSRNGSDTPSLAVAVARLRLKLRAVPGNLPTSREVIADAAVWPLAGPASNHMQWLVTLTSDVDDHKVALFDGMPVTDVVKRQLKFLALAIVDAGPDGQEGHALEVCETLMLCSKVSTRMNERQLAAAQHPSAAMVMRHIMRPATPQWYVPLAASMRAQLGEVIGTSSICDDTLPQLPDRLPAKVSTTKSLADLLGQLDQLGVLALALSRMLEREPALADTRFSALLDAYESWRKDFFPGLDRWLRPLIDTKQFRRRGQVR